jgi:ribosomal protein S18 acetylase RimI-like enzyme
VTWEIFPVDEHTLAPTADALARAFADDPLFRFLAVTDAALRRWLPVAQVANLRMTLPDGHTYGLRSAAGRVVGGMCLLPPGGFPVPPGRTLSFLWDLVHKPNPWTPPPLRAFRRGRPYLEAWEAMHVQMPHWYLYNVGVTTDARGFGCGRQLVGRAIALAEEDGLPIYLETQTRANLGFYRHMGFHVVEQRSPHPHGPATWGLLRDG